MPEGPETQGRNTHSVVTRVAVVIIVTAAAAAAFYLRGDRQSPEPAAAGDAENPASTFIAVAQENQELDGESAALPRMVELGRGQCVACKAMKPILEGLARDLEGKIAVELIDVDEAPEKAREFNVRLIPLQVFIAPDGSELYRHEGFFSREDILSKWKELGFHFEARNSDGV